MLLAACMLGLSFANAQPVAATAGGRLADIQTWVTTQSAEGIPALSLSIARAMGEYMAKRAETRARDWLVAHGQPNLEVPKAESVATLVDVQGEDVAVIRIAFGEFHQMAAVVVIRKDRLLRIACMRPGSDPVPITFGPCADKIKETLGYRLAPVDSSRFN